MKIAFMSDAHAEKYHKIPLWLPPLPDEADILLLVGDMHVGVDLVRLVRSIREQMPELKIIVVPGNHEFYGSGIFQMIDYYREVFDRMDNVSFLYNDSIEINGVTFIGATLWSDFSPHKGDHDHDSIMAKCSDRFRDFAIITDDSDPDNPVLLTAEKMKSLCIEAKEALDEMLSKSDPKKTVVMTHFPPRKELLNKNYEVDEYTAYFNADCQELFRKYRPAYCVYGHNHYSDQMVIDGTIFLSNQPGYLLDKKDTKFNINRIIEL